MIDISSCVVLNKSFCLILNNWANSVKMSFVSKLLINSRASRRLLCKFNNPVKCTKLFSIKMADTEENVKRLKLNGLIKIGTHDGQFHCDEALACFILKQLDQYKDAEIVRSRKSEVLAGCDIVIDVGAVFDVTTHRYDHHQNTFNETFSSLKPECGNAWNIRLSSAGLVYTYFGEEVIRQIVKKEKGHQMTDKELRAVYVNVYKNFIREIDGIDNGVPMFDGEPAYNIKTNLSSRVGRLNLNWITEADKSVDVESLFRTAMELTGREFIEEVLYNTFVWWPARAIVTATISKRYSIHESGEILELEQFCPWKHHLYELEVIHGIVGVPKYVIFMGGKPNDWRVICVPNAPESFVCRKFLHKEWRGVRDDDLATISGIPDAGFCNSTGFIGGSRTREGALQMAIKSLEGKYVD